MRYQILPVSIFAFVISVSTVHAEETPKVIELKEYLSHGEMQVLGEAEMVQLPEHGVAWEARIDSGATTTSVHAQDIEEFERDGEDWVRFVLRNDEQDVSVKVERKVERFAEILKRGGGHHRRPVIKMDVAIGEVVRRIDVNLSDRSGFEYPILIGRNYLSGVALIDVSREYIQDTSVAE